MSASVAVKSTVVNSTLTHKVFILKYVLQYKDINTCWPFCAFNILGTFNDLTGNQVMSPSIVCQVSQYITEKVHHQKQNRVCFPLSRSMYHLLFVFLP